VQDIDTSIDTQPTIDVMGIYFKKNIDITEHHYVGPLSNRVRYEVSPRDDVIEG
jgi:hypothetical protein